MSASGAQPSVPAAKRQAGKHGGAERTQDRERSHAFDKDELVPQYNSIVEANADINLHELGQNPHFSSEQYLNFDFVPPAMQSLRESTSANKDGFKELILVISQITANQQQQNQAVHSRIDHIVSNIQKLVHPEALAQKLYDIGREKSIHFCSKART